MERQARDLNASSGTRPKPSWANRAQISALARLLPKPRRIRLLVTPGALLRQHADMVKGHWALRRFSFADSGNDLLDNQKSERPQEHDRCKSDVTDQGCPPRSFRTHNAC